MSPWGNATSGYWLGEVVQGLFISMYESFNPLTTVNKQHFIEWFSGDGLDSIWTTGNAGGSGTFTMEDIVDGGFSVTSGGTAGDFSFIGFNDIRPYDPSNSVFIAIVKSFSTVNGDERTGLVNSVVEEGTSTDGVMFRELPSATNFSMLTVNSSLSTHTEGSVARDTNWHSVKITNTASNSISLLDGVTDVTITTNLPNEKLQPRIATARDVAAGKVGVRYCEVYNT